MIDYTIRRITTKEAKTYIHKNHYSKGSHNGPSPCYGLFDKETLIGCIMFCVPCSERVRSSIFGVNYKNSVLELHRLHILDVTPKNTESWFISRVLKLLKIDRPDIYAVLSFADPTEGHTGIIYKATNAYFIGTTAQRTFYRDETGRLRHPRQNGVNITKTMAKKLNWISENRLGKNRYLWILAHSKTEKKHLLQLCKYSLNTK